MKLLLLASALLISSSAQAENGLVNLKQVQVSPGARQIDLLFDGKVAANQIRTEFINDVIQLSLMDVGVYPAKISAVNGGDVTKIFAYQYTPRLVRARFTVKGKAESYRDKVEVVPSGKILSVRFVGAAAAAAATTSDKKSDKTSEDKHSAAHPISAPERAQPFDPAEDKALLERVMKGAPAPGPETQAPSASERNAEAKRQERSQAKASDKPLDKPSKTLGGAKPLPSPFAGLWKLALVLAAFGGLAWAARKWMPGSFKNGLKAMRKKANLVEVISTQSLGPKKSISVVRVSGVTLVLGVTSESINLISRLDGDADAELDDESLSQIAIDELTQASRRSGAKAAPSLSAAPRAAAPAAPMASEPAVSPEIRITGTGAVSGRSGFAEYLRNAAPVFAAPASPAPAAPAPTSDVRNRIRNRIEGLKPL